LDARGAIDTEDGRRYWNALTITTTSQSWRSISMTISVSISMAIATIAMAFPAAPFVAWGVGRLVRAPPRIRWWAMLLLLSQKVHLWAVTIGSLDGQRSEADHL
jgi:hypothetical protein